MKNAIRILFSFMIVSVFSACGNIGASNNDIEDCLNESIAIQADYPEYDSAKEMIDVADCILSGSIIDSSCETLDIKTEKGKDSSTGLEKSSKIPYTIYKINIKKLYKGNIKDKTISIKCLGGTVDGDVYSSGMTEQLSKGKDYLFLIKTFEDTYPSLINETQSVYDLNNRDDEKLGEILKLLK